MSNYETASKASVLAQRYEETNKQTIIELKKITQEKGGMINLTAGDCCYGYVYIGDEPRAQEVRIAAIKTDKHGNLIIMVQNYFEILVLTNKEISECDSYMLEDKCMTVPTQTLHNLIEKIEQMYD